MSDASLKSECVVIVYNNTRKETVAFIRHDLLLHSLLMEETGTCILHCSHLSVMPESLPVKHYRVEIQNTYFPMESTSVKKNFKKLQLYLEILFSDLDYMCSPLKSLWENNTWYFFPFMSTYSGDIRDPISVLNLFPWKLYVLIIFTPQFFSEVLNTVPVSQSTGV